MSLELKINTAIKEAMKAKEAATLRALRAVKSAIILAKTEKGGSDNLSEERENKLLAKLTKQRRDSATLYTEQNRPDLAQQEEEELVVLEQFLPKQMSEEEVKAVVQEVITQTGASSPADMGKVMGPIMQRLSGKADGRMISTLVRQLLSS